MSWGLFFAYLGKEAWEKSREVKRNRQMLSQMARNMSDKHEENRKNRSLYVEAGILSQNNLPQLTSEKRMLLEGESFPIPKVTALAPPPGLQSPFRNVVISGGSVLHRNKALVEVCKDASQSGLPIVVVHCSNKQLENMIDTSTSVGKKVIINSSNSFFNPFSGFSDQELTNIFMKSAPGNVKHNWNFHILTNLIAELFRIRTKQGIDLKRLLDIKVNDLPSKILDSRQRGLINDSKMMEMNQRYNAAQAEAGAYQQYLNQVKSRFSYFFRSHSGKWVDIGSAIEEKYVIVIDITDPTNEQFVGMLISVFQLLIGRVFVTCFSDLNLAAYDGVIFDFVNSGTNKFSITSPDIVSSAGGPDKLNSLLGYAPNRIYFGHSDGNHCKSLSDSLGTYRRWNIAYTYSASNKGWVPDLTAGTNISEDIAAKRIPPEVLQSLSGSQMVYQDGETNKIALMCIT